MPEKSPLPDAWSERPAWCSQGTLPRLGDGTRADATLCQPPFRRRRDPEAEAASRRGHHNAPGGLQTLTVEETVVEGMGFGGRGVDDTVRDRKTHLRGR